jgi:hypothetical protein
MSGLKDVFRFSVFGFLFSVKKRKKKNAGHPGLFEIWMSGLKDVFLFSGFLFSVKK